MSPRGAWTCLEAPFPHGGVHKDPGSRKKNQGFLPDTNLSCQLSRTIDPPGSGWLPSMVVDEVCMSEMNGGAARWGLSPQARRDDSIQPVCALWPHTGVNLSTLVPSLSWWWPPRHPLLRHVVAHMLPPSLPTSTRPSTTEGAIIGRPLFNCALGTSDEETAAEDDPTDSLRESVLEPSGELLDVCLPFRL